MVLHDPAGQHAVADLVAQPRIVLAEQVEQGGEELGGRASGWHLGIRLDDGLPECTIRNKAHASPVLQPGEASIAAGPTAEVFGATRGAGPGAAILARCGGALQLIPWKAAGRVTEEQASADEVVQATGWVFNNETGDTLTLAEFVATGDSEVAIYIDHFGLGDGEEDQRRLVEIGCGIGRMTCAFTRRFGTVDRLRPRRRLPRALPRGRRPVRHGRAAAHRRGRRRPHAAPP